MTAADVFAHLWAVCAAYPLQSAVFVLVLVALGTVFALILLSPARPTPDEQKQDDLDQLAAVTRPTPLPIDWNRSGGNWWGHL